MTPDGPHAVVAGGVERHAAPAAADVEQPHARLEAELAADQLVLVGLGLLERVGRVVEHGARVGHARAQHHPVEVVGDVVVVADGRRVAGPASGARPWRLGLLGGRRQPAHLAPAAQLAATSRSMALGSSRTFGHAVAQVEQRPDVAVELEVAGHVGPGEAQLAGRGDDAPQRVGRADDHGGRGVRRAGATAVVGLDRQRQVATEHLLDQRRQRHSNPHASRVLAYDRLRPLSTVWR